MKLHRGTAARILALLVCATAACSSPPPSIAPTVIVPPALEGPASPAPKLPWRIGAYLSLTGESKAFGVDAKEGVDLALEQVNARGGVNGRPVEVIYRDDMGLVDQTSAQVLALIQHDEVVALLGEVSSVRSRAGGIVANRLGVPMIAPGATHPNVTRVGEFVFRACFTDDAQARAAAEYLVTTSQKKRIAVLFAPEDTYSTVLTQAFRKEVIRLGGQIVVEEALYQRETDFTVHLAEISRHQPDIIYAPLYYNTMSLLAAQAKAAGMRGDLFFGGDGWDADDLLGAGAALEGAAFTSHWVVDAPWPPSRAFVAAYRARYHQDPSSVVALSFDTLKLLADAFGRSADDTRKGVRQAIQDTRGFVGATGRLTMGQDRDPVRDIVVVQIKGGHFAYLTTVKSSPARY
jgi:branched-chain amino acid transport system substrate-binding protein